MAKSMYDIIKTQKGERFAKAIRNYDNGIFDVPDIDKIVKYAGHDAEPIMNYLISLKQIKIQEMSVHMDPIKLLDKAGYNAYIADTLIKQNAIKKYYAPGEEICTFRDNRRFKDYYIINAVRKDVDKIKRSFNPQRDDKYGTSVISIQVLKSGGFISIKNRYNHTVQNCDNTLNSNPDNIIRGLSDAIKHHFNVDFSAQQVPLPSHYVLINGQICRYNSEVENIYFGETFYVKDGHIYEIDTNSEIMIGNGILFDTRSKQFVDLTGINNIETIRYRFVVTLNKAIQGKKITVQKNPLGGRDILADGVPVLTVENGEIVHINLSGVQDAIYLAECSNLRGEMDFSQVSNLVLKNSDLSGVDKLKLPEYAAFIHMQGAKLPKCESDLSKVSNVILSGADLSRVTNFKIRPDMYMCEGVKFPKCELDFCGHSVNLSRADLSRVTKLNFSPDVRHLFLSSAQLPNVDLDFSNAEILVLRGSDLRNFRIKLPKSGKTLNLLESKLPAVDLDLSNFESVWVDDADLSRVTSLKFPRTEVLEMERVIFPAIDIDVRQFDKIDMCGADLSRVKSLRIAKKTDWINLSTAKLPAIDLDFTGAKYVHLDECDLSPVTSLKGASLHDMLRWGTARLKQKITQTLKRGIDVQNTNDVKER
ncbi:MAG: pentapeptide repeat-containing protein [Alphaproteobacteria bacterium]